MVSTAFIFTDFQFAADGLFSRVGYLFCIALCGIYARGYGFLRLSAFFQAWAMIAGLALPVFLACVLLASTGLPLVDRHLIAVDQLMGFDWLSLHHTLQHQPEVFFVGERIYLSLQWQPTLLILALAMLMQHTHLWRFITAWFLALLITIAIFPFTPAVGGFIHHGITSQTFPHLSEQSISGWYGIFEQVREGEITKLGANTVTGIVTFPSFHAAGAVLLAYGWMKVKWLRWPMAALNIGVFATSTFIGGHYLVDLIAGATIAITSIIAASRLKYLRADDIAKQA